MIIWIHQITRQTAVLWWPHEFMDETKWDYWDIINMKDLELKI